MFNKNTVMNLSYLVVVFILSICLKHVSCENSAENECPNKKTDLGLIRKRRHLVFPDSTNFVATISLVKALMTHAPSGWNIALEIDVAFPLPDANITLAHHRRKLHKQQKREILNRISDAFELHNLNGKACVLRAICEVQTQLISPGRSLVHDILRAIFLLPSNEDDVKEVIGDHYDLFSKPGFCSTSPDYCQISLIDFIFAFNKKDN